MRETGLQNCTNEREQKANNLGCSVAELSTVAKKRRSEPFLKDNGQLHTRSMDNKRRGPLTLTKSKENNHGR